MARDFDYELWPTMSTIRIQILPPFRQRISPRWLRHVIRLALESDSNMTPTDEEVGLLVTDDQTIQELNYNYRGLDEITDVLAFSPVHHGHYEGDADFSQMDLVPFPDHESQDAGEVIVCYPQAERQAVEAGHSLHRELATLIIHGVLHLKGYDHVEPQEERAMSELQDGALSRISARCDPRSN